MIFRSIIVTALLVGFSAAGEIQKSSGLRSLQGNGNNKNNNNNNNKNNNNNNNKNKTKSKKMKKPCTLVLRLEQFKDGTESHKWDCELDIADSGTIVSFEKDRKFKRDQFDSGISTLFGDVTIFSNGKATIKGNPSFSRRKSKNKNDADRHLAVLGDKTVLAIRVQGNDAVTTASEGTIADEIFGSGNDVFNLATGFSQCSSGALNFIPATQHTSVGNDGVYTVVLNESIAGLTDSELRTKVVNAATAELGSLSSQFDHVMLCLPNISGFGGIAYAYVNSWLSVYKDAWCNYPSAQLHEIGHNIGLAHSGESATYDDQTGMMGYSYGQDEGPRMCFNNAKNWQLGWYADRRATVTPLVSSSWTGNLVGVAQYSSISDDGQFVILKVEGDTSLDYYVGFNRATGINVGTQEARNEVTIQSRALGTGYAQSTLVAKLSAGGTFSISNFGNSGNEVEIKVLSIDITSSTSFAKVEVYKVGVETKAPSKTPTKAPSQNQTNAPTKNPTKAPTKNPTETPTKSPTKAPIVTSSPTKAPVISSPTKSPILTVEITTDDYPSETSWEIVDKCNGDEIVLSGGSYSSGSTTFSETGFFPESQYSFVIKDSFGDGICCAYGQGQYTVKQNGSVVAEGGEFGRVDTKTWGSCPVTSGNSITVEITTDNYPSETSWEIVDKCNGDEIVLSGGPYPYDSTTFSKTKNSLPPSQYSFVIKDTWGDGICCAYGQGQYTVKQNGLQVAEGGEFGRVDTKTWGSCS